MVFLLQLTFWQTLEQADQWLFIKLNNDWTNPVFDSIMPFMRNGKNWAPLYLFLGVFALLNFKRTGIWWCVFFLVTAALTDMTGTQLFKHQFERLRPCSDPDFRQQVRLLVDYCSGGFSFISNHAANHFGLAAFFYITLKPVLGKWAAAGFVWATLIVYAQVYVGVHYPLDVLAGAIVGLILGTITGRVFNKRFGFAIFGNQPIMSP
ncbi:MAG: phosphatase PAP2 family protein [Chitinophagaceae bacterium]